MKYAGIYTYTQTVRRNSINVEQQQQKSLVIRLGNAAHVEFSWQTFPIEQRSIQRNTQPPTTPERIVGTRDPYPRGPRRQLNKKAQCRFNGGKVTGLVRVERRNRWMKRGFDVTDRRFFLRSCSWWQFKLGK